MLTPSELFPQLPPNIQRKPFLPFQLCLPSGHLLQTSELLAVCSCSLQIFSSILQDAECSREKPVVLLHTLSRSPEWELRALCSCGIWPLLWTTVFLDCLNLKHVTAWMTSSVLYLLSPGCGPHSWKAFIEINAFMKKDVRLITWFTAQLRAAASRAEDHCVPFIQIYSAGVLLIGICPQRLGIACMAPGYLILTQVLVGFTFWKQTSSDANSEGNLLENTEFLLLNHQRLLVVKYKLYFPIPCYFTLISLFSFLYIFILLLQFCIYSCLQQT